MSNHLMDKLVLYAQNNLNVLLVGHAGIGKTSHVKALAEKLNLKFKYYSASTLDPWADLVGIPVPDKETKTLEFYRPKDLENAELVFFDELNRAHPKVLNAVLELVQFKSINGVKLPQLKAVWAAINPPGGDYQVEELDPALVDRFHCFIKMEPELNRDYLKTKMPDKLVQLLANWWTEDCSEENRLVMTPRRIEYLGFLVHNNLPWRDVMPPGHILPTKELEGRLTLYSTGDEGFEFNRQSIIDNKDVVLDRIKDDPKCVLKVAEVMKKFNPSDYFECRDILESFPKDTIAALFMGKWPAVKNDFLKCFSNTKIDVKLSYPKIYEVVFRDLATV